MKGFIWSTKGAVHADREDRIRRKRSKESIYSLTAERSARQITYRKTDHDRQLVSMFLHHGERCIYHRLAVECIEDGFDESRQHRLGQVRPPVRIHR